ncbi:MAG: alkaline phosphatase family protein [Candidatus Dormibacteria bacterium]
MTASHRLMAVLALGVLALPACSAMGRTPARVPTPPRSPAAPPIRLASPSPTVPASAGLVVVIVMENHSIDQVIHQPYLSSLAQRGAVLDSYHPVSHPSLPNYLALTSGRTWGISDDGYHVLPPGANLGAQLSAAGITWKAYMEGMTRGCLDSPAPYAVKHNPFAYYGGSCPANVVPFARLQSDEVDGTLPRFVWITPNLCDDSHNCSASSADAWLAGVVPSLLASPGLQDHGLLAIVWDEGGSNSDLSGAVLVSPDIRPGSSSLVDYNHYSLLAAVEDRLRVSRLGAAATAVPFSDVLTPLPG